MKRIIWYPLMLQLFSGEGEGTAQAQTGDSNADAGQMDAQNSEEEFSRLINGKFKDNFTKKTQEIIDKRFKQTKELEAYKSRVSPMVEKLMERYGFGPGEEEKLFDALNSSEKKEEATNQDSARFHEGKLKDKIGGWLREGDELKQAFPQFDLRKELRESKLFSQMLLSGVPLKTAYETVHKDEIISNAMQFTADAVRKQVVSNIEAKGRRPVENGVSSEGAVVSAVDVNSLTSQDILKILKQVENGASISF